MGVAIEIRGLSYSYPSGAHALRGVDLTIDEGESAALIGPNGAGKSTLVLHLNGILPGSDCVRVCGMEVSRPNLKAIRRRVGLVFQDPDDQLFMPTVFDDVAFGPINMGLSEQEVRGRVSRALAQVGMTGSEDRAPYHLSGGEKRRVAIATVLSMDTQIMVMDEPTSNLDPRSRGELIELLNGLEMTKIVVSHDLDMVAQVCQRVILLDQGKVVADGSAAVVLSDQAVLAEHGLGVRRAAGRI